MPFQILIYFSWVFQQQYFTVTKETKSVRKGSNISSIEWADFCSTDIPSFLNTKHEKYETWRSRQLEHQDWPGRKTSEPAVILKENWKDSTYYWHLEFSFQCCFQKLCFLEKFFPKADAEFSIFFFICPHGPVPALYKEVPEEMSTDQLFRG